MEEIKNIVGKVMAGLQQKQPAQQIHIQKTWERVLGPAQAGHTRILELNGGTMVVLVDSPARLYYLNLKKGQIIRAVRREHPDISEVYFKTGTVHE